MSTPERSRDVIERRALAIHEFCKAYGLSRSTAYRMIATGTLPSVKVGKRRLIPANAAEALLQLKGC